MAKDLGFEAQERKLTVQQWRDDIAAGRMTEVFACGTAAVITPVGTVKARGFAMLINQGENGPVTMAFTTRCWRSSMAARPTPITGCTPYNGPGRRL